MDNLKRSHNVDMLMRNQCGFFLNGINLRLVFALLFFCLPKMTAS